MSGARRGTGYGVAAYALWGLFPLSWTLLVVAVLLAVSGRYAALRRVGRRRLAMLAGPGSEPWRAWRWRPPAPGW